MRHDSASRSAAPSHPGRRRGTVLIIVLWMALGLVAVTLYFANSMSMALRAAGNRAAGAEAAQAIAGASRYVASVFTEAASPGMMPDAQAYVFAAAPVGSATFWLIGRGDSPAPPDQPVFGLVDEASKLNLNTATAEMLEALPGMTPQLAQAIVNWRSAASANPSGADVYQRLNPPYHIKNGLFESVDELRLVDGADRELLFGEDANLNGCLDAGEDANKNGILDPGILEYVTVYSREPNTQSDGTPRVSVAGGPAQHGGLSTLLRRQFGDFRATDILLQLGPAPVQSVLEFYMRSAMKPDEFTQIEGSITASNAAFSPGLINVNTASKTVLACIPGITSDKAETLVAARQSNPSGTNSIAWVAKVLDLPAAAQAGPYLTGRSFQFTADIAAVGRHGRGFQRVRFVCDTSGGAPQIVYRQDLTHLGWALGSQVREDLSGAKDAR